MKGETKRNGERERKWMGASSQANAISGDRIETFLFLDGLKVMGGGGWGNGGLIKLTKNKITRILAQPSSPEKNSYIDTLTFQSIGAKTRFLYIFGLTLTSEPDGLLFPCKYAWLNHNGESCWVK